MKATRPNPWSALPYTSPFVLKEDEPFVRAFNQDASAQHRLNLDLLPEPFFGNRSAPVVVLLLNPGIGPNTTLHHRNEAFAASIRADIASTNPRQHFHLTDSTNGPGFHWWRKACSKLLQDGLEVAVATRLLNIQFFPYHSKSFAHGHVRLPSQEFSFSLLRAAIGREALVVCMRGLKQWRGAVPELDAYHRLITPNNTRAGALSPNNLSKYEYLRSALK